MLEQLKEVRSVFENHLERLKKQAHESSIRFERYTVDENGKRDTWKDKNTLKFRARKEGNSVMLEWYRRRWTRDGEGIYELLQTGRLSNEGEYERDLSRLATALEPYTRRRGIVAKRVFTGIATAVSMNCWSLLPQNRTRKTRKANRRSRI